MYKKDEEVSKHFIGRT